MRRNARRGAGDRHDPFQRLTVAAAAWARGRLILDPPQSLIDYVLLSRVLPGYTRAELEAEDPEWLAEVQYYAQVERQLSGGG